MAVYQRLGVLLALSLCVLLVARADQCCPCTQSEALHRWQKEFDAERCASLQQVEGITPGPAFGCRSLGRPLPGQEDHEPLLKQFNTFRRMVGSPDLKWDTDLTKAARTAALKRVEDQNCELGKAEAGELVWGCNLGDCAFKVDQGAVGECFSLVSDWTSPIEKLKVTSTMYTDNKNDANMMAFAQLAWASTRRMGCDYAYEMARDGRYTCFVVACRFDTPTVHSDAAFSQNIKQVDTSQKQLQQKPGDNLNNCPALKQAIPDLCSNESYQFQRRPLSEWCSATCSAAAP